MRWWIGQGRTGSSGPREPDAGALPPGIGREKVAIGRADVTLARQARTPPKNHLVAHELAVVFAEVSVKWDETRVSVVRALGPFPNVPEELGGQARVRRIADRRGLESISLDEVSHRLDPLRDDFPFCLRREPRFRPARVRVSLVVAHVADGGLGVDRA